MTTTPEYIRKCEMAEEIQAMRAPIPRGYCEFAFQHGDNFIRFSGDVYTLEYYGTTILQPNFDGGYFYRPTAFRKSRDGDIRVDKIIWLPRLDQLLDIATGMEISIGEVDAILGENREEKLLTVIMRNKFGKKWDGEKWVAERKNLL